MFSDIKSIQQDRQSRSSSLVGLILDHLLVGFHATGDVLLFVRENVQGHFVEVLPCLIIVHPQVSAHGLNYLKEITHSSIDVRLVGVRLSAEQMRKLIIGVFLNEVPHLLVRAILHDKLAFVVFNLAELDRIISLFLFRRVLGCFVLLAMLFHHSTLALLFQILLNTSVNCLGIEHACALLEALQHDRVLDVLKNLVVDASERLRTSHPGVVPVRVILVEAFPDPGPLHSEN